MVGGKGLMVTVDRLDDGRLSGRIAALEAECFADPWSEDAVKEAIRFGTVFFAALEDGNVLGYVGVKPVLDEGYISNVAVTEKMRRRGIGKALMASVDSFAAESGLSFVSLEVRESNSAAAALYFECGYEIVGKRKNFYVHPVEDALIMIKNFKREE